MCGAGTVMTVEQVEDVMAAQEAQVEQLQAQLPCLRPLTTPDLLARRAASPAHSPTSARASAGRPCRAYPPSNSTWQGKTMIRRPTKRGDLRC